MSKCKHECPSCEEEWECEFPLNSDYLYLETTIHLGYYCNAWCPVCETKKRSNMDELFGDTSNTGYLKGLRHHQLLKNK